MSVCCSFRPLCAVSPIVESVFEKDRRLIYQAVQTDPLTSALLTLPKIRQMVDEMLMRTENTWQAGNSWVSPRPTFSRKNLMEMVPMTTIAQRFLPTTAPYLPAVYNPLATRYDHMPHRRAGRSGLMLPAISIGLWQNFGDADPIANCRAILRRAFDLGMTYFDVANNYGPPQGAAESMLGQIFKDDFRAYRDELVIATKAGYDMWPGPYGEWGSRKYLVASLDQSLKRIGVDYADIYYSHRPDPETPLEETMGALDHLVRSGKALYAGISNYSPEQTREAARILRELRTPLTIHQPRYSMLDRHIEDGLLGVLDDAGTGCVVYSPLEQGILTERYLRGVPDDSRAGKAGRFLKPENVTEEKLQVVRKLAAIARRRGQSLAQMAVTWILRQSTVTSVLIGASRPGQLDELASGLSSPQLTPSELHDIDEILNHGAHPVS